MKLLKLKQTVLVLICITLVVAICYITGNLFGSQKLEAEFLADNATQVEKVNPISEKSEEVKVVQEEITEILSKPKPKIAAATATLKAKAAIQPKVETGTKQTIVEMALVKEELETVEKLPSLDRTKPLYNIYAHGIQIDVTAELQWLVHDICEEYGFYEKYVYGMVITESAFNPKAENGIYKGLCQIGNYWKSAPTIPHFTEHPENRDLTDPYDNMLTLAELWSYARDTYGLDLMTEDGMMRVCYWHNTGKDPRYITSSSYFNTCAAFADELEPLQ